MQTACMSLINSKKVQISCGFEMNYFTFAPAFVLWVVVTGKIKKPRNFLEIKI